MFRSYIPGKKPLPRKSASMPIGAPPRAAAWPPALRAKEDGCPMRDAGREIEISL